MEPDFHCIYLLLFVSMCNGESCQASYNVVSICETQYDGVISMKHLRIRNVSECASICSNEESCRSTVYNYKTEECRTFPVHLDNLANNCTEMVQYVTLDTFEVSSL